MARKKRDLRAELEGAERKSEPRKPSGKRERPADTVPESPEVKDEAPISEFKKIFPDGSYDGRSGMSGAERPITAAELVAREHEWFEKGYVPRDLLTLLVGDSDSGKSTYLAYLAGRWTKGVAVGSDVSNPPGNVLIYSAEEDAGATIRPRLEEAGAKLYMVHLGDVGRGGRPLPRLMFPDDLGKLDRRIKDLRITLLILDPITAYLSGSVDQRNDQPVRQLLSGLVEIAERNGCTMLATKHYRKGKEGGPLDWIGGAPAWHQVPRVILAFGSDPDDKSKRVLSVSKNSLMPKPPSVRFEIMGPQGRPKYTPLGECCLTAEDIGAGALNPADRDALGDAQAFLLDVLGAEEKPAKDIVRIAQESGIALGTLRRAKAKLGVTSHPVGPNGQRFIVWRAAPQQAPQGPPASA